MELHIPTKIQDHIRLLTGLLTTAGPSAALRWELLRSATKLGFSEPAEWRVRPHPVAYPLRVRLRGSSDMAVFDQIFIRREYSWLRDLKEPSLVLDLGAYVGFSSAYFLSIFPRARVLAVEPYEPNVAKCRANLSPYGDRVRILHGAVWSRRASLRLLTGAFGDGREWTTQVEECLEEEAPDVGIQAWDLRSLIDMSGRDMVDLLKIDIERAELSVFGEGSAAWLDRVRNICIELHGKDCEEVFFRALNDFDYDLGYFGELTICRNLRRKKAARTTVRQRW